MKIKSIDMNKYIMKSVKRLNISIVLLLVSGILFSSVNELKAQTEAEAIIFIDSTAQIIRGFGAANIVGWRPDMTEEDMENAFGTNEGELGLSIMRLQIQTNPNQWSNNLASAQKAHEMGILIWAAPWTAPADMLDPDYDGEGSRIADDKYQEYVDHLNAYNTFMKENGVPLYAISVQNEPDYGNWTRWTPDEMLRFMRDYAHQIDNKVMAPESFQFRREMSDPILNDSLAAANLDIMGGHIYGGGNARYPLAEEMGKEVWMTEYLLNQGATSNWHQLDEEVIWQETMQMATSVQTSMKNNFNTYIWWYLKRYYSFIGDGDQGTRDGEILKRGYAFSQFSRFVRPGFYRIHTQEPFGRGLERLSVTAYKDSNQVVIIAANDESSDIEVEFSLSDYTLESVTPYITSLTQNIEQLDDVEISENKFIMTLPAKSVITFVGENYKYTPTSIADLENVKPKEYVLSQNYPNPFNPTTVINYQLPASSHVTLKVYDLMGREVATIINEYLPAGEHQTSFDATHLVSGVYFYRLQTEDFIQTRQMMLVK